jgi:hypothetical protein
LLQLHPPYLKDILIELPVPPKNIKHWINYTHFDHNGEAAVTDIRMKQSDSWVVVPTCSHSLLEKQYTIPDSLFGYDSLIKFAISSMTTFPTGDFSYTYMVNKFYKYNKAS